MYLSVKHLFKRYLLDRGLILTSANCYSSSIQRAERVLDKQIYNEEDPAVIYELLKDLQPNGKHAEVGALNGGVISRAMKHFHQFLLLSEEGSSKNEDAALRTIKSDLEATLEKINVLLKFWYS